MKWFCLMSLVFILFVHNKVFTFTFNHTFYYTVCQQCDRTDHSRYRIDMSFCGSLVSLKCTHFKIMMTFMCIHFFCWTFWLSGPCEKWKIEVRTEISTIVDIVPCSEFRWCKTLYLFNLIYLKQKCVCTFHFFHVVRDKNTIRRICFVHIFTFVMI